LNLLGLGRLRDGMLSEAGLDLATRQKGKTNEEKEPRKKEPRKN
jgi:hypothetical protein